MIRFAILAAVLLAASPALAIDLCRGGDRAARKVTCVVDGDTIWEAGVKLRLLDIDTPETDRAECPQEREAGRQATLRLIELMQPGYSIEWSGRKDRTSDRRDLVRITLADGRDAGAVLLEEGLAQPWPNKSNPWCGR